MISHDHRCIFVHIPRTGGTSIEVALTGQDWDYVDRYEKHLTAQVSRDLYYLQWDDYFTFSVVRNPFDRLVSIYCGSPTKISSRFSFEEFILGGDWYFDWEPSIDNQCDVARGVEKIYRFEDLGEAWSDISARLGISVALSHERRNNRERDWRGYYTDRARDYVSDLCRKDLETFGYEF